MSLWGTLIKSKASFMLSGPTATGERPPPSHRRSSPRRRRRFSRDQRVIAKKRWISRQKFYLFQRIKWPDKQQSMSTGWLPSIAARIERWRWTLVSPWECVPHFVEIVAVTPKVWKTSIVSILSSLVCCQDLSKVGYVRGVVRRAHKVISSDIPLPMTVYQTNKVMINRIIFFHLNSVINL